MDFHNLEDRLGSSPNQAYKRAPSIYSQHTQLTQHPLPHRPQAHFYGAPEIDFGAGRPGHMPGPAREGLCCTFDKLTSKGRGSSGRSESVLLVGFDHGLDVYHVDKKRFDRIGRLSGLRGSVIGAKILPPASNRRDLHSGQPLVALVIHGPRCLDETLGEANTEIDEFDPSASMVQAPQPPGPDLSLYETTVEVYSLPDGVRVQTLFRSPAVEVEAQPYGPPIVPPPVGDLAVQAKGRFLVVSSGQSGEVYVFEWLPDGGNRFQCIGKTWTKTTRRVASRSVSVSSASDSGAPGLHEGSGLETRQIPRANLSLSSRWLAYVPPPSSSQNTLHGSIAAQGSSSNKVHGATSHTSPAEPSVTCQLDTPEGESYLNKAVRDASQTFIKGARWVGDQGVQAWNSYWRPDQSHSQPGSPPPAVPPPNPQHFPPTHAQESKAKTVRSQASLVSILDLEKLSKSQSPKAAALALQPLATFTLPYGCSLVSFSPDGLKLLTASAKGDVQQVWDLMRMIHGDTSRFTDQTSTNPLKGPTVREVARFPRMTEARIVNVVWTEPQGARLAILTGKGTAHIFDLPSKAFQWPPPRPILTRDATSFPQTNEKNDDEEPPRRQTATASTPSASSLTSAFNILSSTTTSTIAAVRGRRSRPTSGSLPTSTSTSTSFPTSTSIISAGVAQGGKSLAQGVNRSVSAAAGGVYDTLRHLGENRIALPVSVSSSATATETVVAPGSVHWLLDGALAVTAAGLVRIYSVSDSGTSGSVSGSGTKGGGSGGSGSGSSSRKRRSRPSVLSGGKQPVEFVVPRAGEAAAAAAGDDVDDDAASRQQQPDTATATASFWRPSAGMPTSTSTTTYTRTHPLSHAEIDTAAAYQPVHTERRVGFWCYDDAAATDADAGRGMGGGREGGTKTWVFGLPIPAVRVGGGGGGGKRDYGDDEGEDEGGGDDGGGDGAKGDVDDDGGGGGATGEEEGGDGQWVDDFAVE